MPQETFRALIVEEIEPGRFRSRIGDRRLTDLPLGELLVRVDWSSVNYKDALSAAGHRGVTRHYPHTPGIDAAGVVLEDSSGTFAPGEEVIVTGHDLGMNTAGGFAQRIRVPAAWAVPLPAGLSTRQSMQLGTAGFTAALALLRLQQEGITPDCGVVLVTGGSGGVGSLALRLLAHLGYQPAALNGRTDRSDWLLRQGAVEIVPADAGIDTSGRMLLHGRWAGAVDTLGGEVLATLLKSLLPGGCVAACGNAASHRLDTTVYPFILNGAILAGINSATTPMQRRLQAWNRLAGEWRLPQLDDLTTEIGLDDLPTVLAQLPAGHVPGRFLVRLED